MVTHRECRFHSPAGPEQGFLVWQPPCWESQLNMSSHRTTTQQWDEDKLVIMAKGSDQEIGHTDPDKVAHDWVNASKGQR